ncbi:MAG TPA: STAS domain-containing protein [Gammaproteobacteria bacterium]|nr:STAS domain-containing protein [Gammaproteobacteria bacterium]
MQIEQSTEREIPVLTPNGRLDTDTAPAFETALLETLTEMNRVIVDLTEVDYVSSAGLRVVLMGAKRARKAEGGLVLCGMAPSIRDVFAVSGFLKILTTAESREQAAELLVPGGD